MGRLAEAEGESAIYRDLRMKLFINPDTLKAHYATSPAWLKKLMVAWADGFNFYLVQASRGEAARDHALRAVDGADASPKAASAATSRTCRSPALAGVLRRLIGEPHVRVAADSGFAEPSGSNGIAIAPSNTVDHHALLLINPHTSFFFRSELQMTSDEGLNAYGAATWGQFFIYQGFNTRTGWMHTSSGADVVDEYARDGREEGRQSLLQVRHRGAAGHRRDDRHTV